MYRETVVDEIRELCYEWYDEPSNMRRTKSLERQSYKLTAVEHLCKYIYSREEPRDIEHVCSMIDDFARLMEQGYKMSKTWSAKEMYAAGTEVAFDMLDTFSAME